MALQDEAAMSTPKRPLRSERWLGRDDFRSFNHRSRVMQMGYDPKDWEGKPGIAVVNNWSDYNPCHMHFMQRVDDVSRGVLGEDASPLVLLRSRLGTNLSNPPALLYRNLLAI